MSLFSASRRRVTPARGMTSEKPRTCTVSPSAPRHTVGARSVRRIICTPVGELGVPSPARAVSAYRPGPAEANASGSGSAVCADRLASHLGMSALPCQTTLPFCSLIRSASQESTGWPSRELRTNATTLRSVRRARVSFTAERLTVVMPIAGRLAARQHEHAGVEVDARSAVGYGDRTAWCPSAGSVRSRPASRRAA